MECDGERWMGGEKTDILTTDYFFFRNLAKRREM